MQTLKRTKQRERERETNFQIGYNLYHNMNIYSSDKWVDLILGYDDY